MKIPSTTATPLAAVILACALSTGGQQGTQKGPVPKNNQPGFIPVTQRIVYLPDGRTVAFPIGMSEEEIDALAKRIAAGAVELPLGARVIGWKPVEGATSLLPGYDQRVATIPTMKGKLESLANAADILQTQIDSRDNLTNQRIDLAFSRLASLEKHDDELTKMVNLHAAVLSDGDSRLRMTTNQLDDLKRELHDFKDAACPVLRRAAKGPRRSWDDVAGVMTDQNVQMKLDSACASY